MVGVVSASVLQLFGIAAKPIGKVVVPETASQRSFDTAGLTADQLSFVGTRGTLVDPEHWRDFQSLSKGLRDGSASPLSDLAAKMAKGEIELAASRGLLFEGKFLAGAGDSGTIGHADFADRQTAMLNAYHYSRDLIPHAKQAAHYMSTFSAADLGDPLNAKDLADAERDYRRGESMLRVQFGFDQPLITIAADGTATFDGFEVVHERFGRMLSVDAGGAITFFDQAGTAYTGAKYDAARPDGIIPELVNQLTLQAGRLDGRF